MRWLLDVAEDIGLRIGFRRVAISDLHDAIREERQRAMTDTGKNIHKGKRVRHKQYGHEGTIIEYGSIVLLKLDSGKETRIRKILLWEHYDPVEDDE